MKGWPNTAGMNAQLAELEAALAEKDFLADFKSAMRGERTCAIDTFETQRLTREMRSVTGENGAPNSHQQPALDAERLFLPK